MIIIYLTIAHNKTACARQLYWNGSRETYAACNRKNNRQKSIVFSQTSCRLPQKIGFWAGCERWWRRPGWLIVASLDHKESKVLRIDLRKEMLSGNLNLPKPRFRLKIHLRTLTLFGESLLSFNRFSGVTTRLWAVWFWPSTGYQHNSTIWLLGTESSQQWMAAVPRVVFVFSCVGGIRLYVYIALKTGLSFKYGRNTGDFKKRLGIDQHPFLRSNIKPIPIYAWKSHDAVKLYSSLADADVDY